MNDRTHHILQIARTAFLRDSHVSMAEIAREAGVGMSGIYLRFSSREALLQAIALDGLAQFAAVTADAHETEPVAPSTLRAWMQSLIASGALTLGPTLAGTFTTDASYLEAAIAAANESQELVTRFQDAGVLKPDVDLTDLVLMMEALGTVRLATERETEHARDRLLDLLLAGVGSGHERLKSEPVPFSTLAARWNAG